MKMHIKPDSIRPIISIKVKASTPKMALRSRFSSICNRIMGRKKIIYAGGGILYRHNGDTTE
ncbi:MAG: hypothetical protein ACREBV_01310, partial [Candidatus Zixiibacteriota bacterium]